jgi:hypothetical protein
LKVFITKYTLQTGLIEEAECHALTGRPEWVKANGKKPNRHIGPGQWHETLDAARRAVYEAIKSEEDFLDRQVEQIRKRKVQLNDVWDSMITGRGLEPNE